MLGFRVRFELLKQVKSPCPKFTDNCGMNMCTNKALKTRTRCYSFDQYVRKCNDRLVVNMINKKLHCISGQSGIYCVTAAVWNILLTATARAGFTLCVARTRDHRREATLPMLVVVFFAGVAVRCCCCCGLGTRTHTRAVPLTSGCRVYLQCRGRHQAG